MGDFKCEILKMRDYIQMRDFKIFKCVILKNVSKERDFISYFHALLHLSNGAFEFFKPFHNSIASVNKVINWYISSPTPMPLFNLLAIATT